MRGKMWRDAFGVPTYLVELVAEVDRVDVVAFEVREHNDLHDAMPICRERGGAVSRRSSCDRIKFGVSRSQHGRVSIVSCLRREARCWTGGNRYVRRKPW